MNVERQNVSVVGMSLIAILQATRELSAVQLQPLLVHPDGTIGPVGGTNRFQEHFNV